jgi:hypothetical protein
MYLLQDSILYDNHFIINSLILRSIMLSSEEGAVTISRRCSSNLKYKYSLFRRICGQRRTAGASILTASSDHDKLVDELRMTSRMGEGSRSYDGKKVSHHS